MKTILSASINLIVAISLLIPANFTGGSLWTGAATDAAQQALGSDLFRTRVVVDSPSRQTRLEEFGVSILTQGENWAIVLVTPDQLETLARLGFQPGETESYSNLIDGQIENRLNDGILQSTGGDSFDSTEKLEAFTSVLSVEQTAALAGAAGTDDDADGLTNTVESWWCTNPLDSDTDDDGQTDGAEIQVLKDWLGNKRAGPPNNSPWPSWPFNDTTCPDKDYDSIPNLAERWDLGLNMDLESTDRDRFDDGQELFGTTYCPGSGTACGYGSLPTVNHDGVLLFPQMPNWVKYPGNHPLTSAFPFPIIDLVANSITVQTSTTISTDHVISSGTERSYSTAKTEGASTAVSNTVTWNEWQEVSESLQERQLDLVQADQFSANQLSDQQKPGKPSIFSKAITAGKFLAANEIAKAGCTNVSKSQGLSLAAPEGIVGVNEGSDKSLDSEYTNRKCKGFIGIAEKISPELAGFFGDQQNTHQSCSGNCQAKYTPQISTTIENRVVVNNTVDTTNITAGLEGLRYSMDQTGQIIGERLYELSSILASPLQTTTNTSGKSWGGAQTTTTEQYEEHTITNGEAFSSEESWGNATAVDSAHAANMWFAYSVANTGSDLAQEICNLTFNVFLNDDLIYTYFVPTDRGGACFQNLEPGETHSFSARSQTHGIPLTLEQLKQIDLGGKIRVVVEDYTFGADEQFYLDAASANVQLAIEDGTEDGDEAIDNYLVPTWGSETVLDVLGRYFPHTNDSDGNLTAIWTPEYGHADTPAWCANPQVVGAGAQRTLWCQHALSTAEWWNIYTDGMGDGTEGFQDTPAVGGSTALFRFNQDTDLDGYSDRSEARLGTDPANPADLPHPELLGGLHSNQTSSNVVATLSLLNSGLYDAYGVEAVMLAPDDTITITNNTVGGSGRVKAGQSVVVGSRIQPASLGTWTGSAKPASSGYYTGTADRAYSFTVTCDNPGGCEVGSGSWTLAWTDGQGGTGSLPFGTGYASPTPLAVGASGVKVGLLSGRVYNGNTFTVQANTPRDTFQYTINSEPHAQPVVLVSYNDPQGNHRFILPTSTMSLPSPTANLVPFAGQMRQDPGVELVTLTSFLPGVNTTQLVVNNPTGVTLTNSKLFLEFIDPEGTVVAEVSAEQDFAPGPSVVPVSWDSNTFAPAYNPEQDYIVLAFWTDLQGNILDTAGRPLSSFQQDPKPEFAMAAADATWDFGTAAQGTVMRREFTFANTGQLGLLTYVEAPAGLSVSQTGSQGVAPADITRYGIALSTEGLPLGTYDQTLTIHTSDPDQPTQTVRVLGTITAGTADTPVGPVERPLDYTVTVPGPKNQGEWYEFTHDLGPDPQTLHPVKVYSEDYSKLWGVGKYATQFGGEGTASYDMFGDGRDGDLTVAAGQTVTINTLRANVTAFGSGAAVASSSGFSVGDLVLFYQTQGTESAGRYEFNTISIISGNSWTLETPLVYSYDNTNGKAQVYRVPQYKNLTVNSGGVLTAPSWNGINGGLMVMLIQNRAVINGLINFELAGFRGGTGNNNVNIGGQQGESIGGVQRNPEVVGTVPNYGGGGGGWRCNGAAGGGGSYGSSGDYGQTLCGYGGSPGNIYGVPDLSLMFLGSGGGGASDGMGGTGYGRSGGGAVLLYANNLSISGGIKTNGGPGYGGHINGNSFGGGGGSGGSIRIVTDTANVGTNNVTAVGGAGGIGYTGGGRNGGNGGNGRVRLEYCSQLAGATIPAASTERLSCYISEQIESVPYTTAKLTLPENILSTQTYQIQYGQLLTYTEGSYQTTSLQLPSKLTSKNYFAVLVSGVESGDLNFGIDVGNDGSWDWEFSASVDTSAAFTSPDLSAAFNAYWATHGAPTSGYLDVPVRVSLDKPGQVLLTDLQVQAAPSKLRTLRLSAGNYSTVSLNYTLGGAAPVTLGIDVGDNGSVDAAFTTNPGALTSPNLAAAVNAYLSGKTGTVDIPIRFYLSPAASLSLTGFSAALSGKPDASLVNTDLRLPGTSPIEGDTVTLSATLRNPSSLPTGGLTAAFYASAPGWGEWYIGSAFVYNIPPGGTATASLDWNTLGFSGSVPVRVVVDPHDRLNESSESNNQAAGTLAVLTRPDLQVAGIQPSDAEPVAGETVTVTFTAKNAGQTAAGASSWRLYDGDPADGGSLICSPSLAVGAGSLQPQGCPWTPASPGLHRLFVVGDAAGAVGEYDEGNNQLLREVYVGFAGPLLLDSGSAGQDPAYSPAAGYGVVDTGPADLLTTCANWPDPDQTLRQDPGGEVVYQFDHLLPGHYYHLDLILYECNGEGRQESVYVDESLVAGPEDLGDADMHRLSLRLDPALYRDNSVRVVVKAPGGDGAVVAGISLHDVDYRYTDSGSALDVAFPGSKSAGWLDGTPYTSDGTLPYQSYRVDLANNDLRYQFADLDPALRYQLHLTFWQPSGTAHIQRVELDGADSGQVVDTGDYQIHRLTVPIPQSAYQADGSVVVSILRSNASTGPILNEIALEQLTLVEPLSCEDVNLQVTPYNTQAYGMLTFFGAEAPAQETRVLALNPRGQVVGCFVVSTTGQYGMMHIYGEDTTVQPAIPGMRAGERITFQVNGTTAFAQPALYFQSDRAAHNIDLNVQRLDEQSLSLKSGWNLVSFRNEPPSPLVPIVINSIQSRIQRVISETGIYTPTLADPFVTLKEMHALSGYYLLLNGTTTVNWLVAGDNQASDAPIQLHAGWNLIGGPAQTTPVSNALASIAGQYKLVITLSESYNPALPPSFSTLKDMKSGAGYLIYASENTTLIYPAGSGDQPDGTAAQSASDSGICDGLYPTPALSLVYGEVRVNGELAPVGTQVKLFTPRGELAGCAMVPEDGILPLTHLYGAVDEGTPGFTEGEPVTVRINGIPAELDQPLTWSNDRDSHLIAVKGEIKSIYLPVVGRTD